MYEDLSDEDIDWIKVEIRTLILSRSLGRDLSEIATCEAAVILLDELSEEYYSRQRELEEEE